MKPGETPFIEEVPNVDVDGCQVSSELTADGRFELPDPVPMRPPIGLRAPDTLETMIRNIVRGEYIKQAAEQSGLETWEEADDFDIPDDPVDPQSPWELSFDQAVAPGALPEDPPTATAAAEKVAVEPAQAERASSDKKSADVPPPHTST
jgi:hypothetical protein